jgi:hypothetical protein
MIEWAINGVTKLAQAADPSYNLRAGNLITTLELIAKHHSQLWMQTFAESLIQTINRYPNEDWHIALSEFQLMSKYSAQLLLDEHCSADRTVCFQGSWLGLGPLMLLTKHPDVAVTAFDIDDNANQIANHLCKPWAHRAYLADVLYLQQDFKVYVNLITEHLEDIAEWRKTLPTGSIVLASNTDLPDTDHYNTCASVDEFLDKLGVLVPLATETVTAYTADSTAMNRWIVLFES